MLVLKKKKRKKKTTHCTSFMLHEKKKQQSLVTRWQDEKKWHVKTLLGPLAWLHRKIGPPLNSHLIILSGPTFLSLVNNDPFLLPSVFLFYKLRLRWKLHSLSAARPLSISISLSLSLSLTKYCFSLKRHIFRARGAHPRFSSLFMFPLFICTLFIWGNWERNACLFLFLSVADREI